ncbi:hypothetical protein BH11PSE12_BH11PSE12_22140 [soil metagenome]
MRTNRAKTNKLKEEIYVEAVRMAHPTEVRMLRLLVRVRNWILALIAHLRASYAV